MKVLGRKLAFNQLGSVTLILGALRAPRLAQQSQPKVGGRVGADGGSAWLRLSPACSPQPWLKTLQSSRSRSLSGECWVLMWIYTLICGMGLAVAEGQRGLTQSTTLPEPAASSPALPCRLGHGKCFAVCFVQLLRTGPNSQGDLFP